MPASSKSQQRFFGVVKAMQKGDIPKKGRAGKVAKSMTKKDVDDFASTKHKGKPEKVKQETKVRNLIRKMVREILDEMTEGGPGSGPQGEDNPFDREPSDDELKDIEKEFESLNKENLSKKIDSITLGKKKNKGKKNEGTCGYGENGELGEEPAGPHLIKKKKIKESGRNIAKTILQQLGGNKFIAMTGAKNLGSTNKSLQFKIGRNSKSISHVIITLKSSDLYDVEFIRIRGVKRTVVKKLKGVYADMLRKIFTKYTGLRTSL